MYNLRILFTCLCAHVVGEHVAVVILPDARFGCPPMNEREEPENPHNDSCCDDSRCPSAPAPESDTAMLANPPGADDEGEMEPLNHLITPHVGAIQFDPTDLDPTSELKPHLYYRGRCSRRDEAIFFLSGEDVECESLPPGKPAESSGRVDGTNKPGCGAEAADLSWVANVSNIDAAAGWMDRQCLVQGSAAPLDENSRVLTRIRLTGGQLSSAILPINDQGEPMVFGWRGAGTSNHEGAPDYVQALCAAVSYDVSLDGRCKKVTFKVKRFGHQESKRLTFSLAGQPFGYTLQLAFKNMPLDSLLEVERDIFPDKADEVDDHFAMFYALSER